MPDKLNTELQALEAQLSNISATEMPEDMITRMENAMINWETHLPREEKIVPFAESVSAPASATTFQKTSSKFNTWGAAAAVALIATTSALFMSGNDPEVTNTNSSVASNSVIEEQPERFSHNITNASNEGITYAGQDQKPYRVFRFEYTKEVESVDENGNTVITQEPAVETILIPIESK